MIPVGIKTPGLGPKDWIPPGVKVAELINAHLGRILNVYSTNIMHAESSRDIYVITARTQHGTFQFSASWIQEQKSYGIVVHFLQTNSIYNAKTWTEITEAITLCLYEQRQLSKAQII